MFSEQVKLLDDLEGQVEPRLLEVLRGLLGNCQQVLNHRGEINLEWSPNELEGGHANPTLNVGGGYTLNFQEGSILKLDPSMTITGVLQRAQAVADWEENADAPRVQCKNLDARGAQVGANIWVYLTRHTGDADPHIKTSDIVYYMGNSAGTNIAVMDYSEMGPKWARVQAGFVNASGSAVRTVSVKTCDYDGTNEAGGAFDTKTIINSTKYTNLFTNDVVGYRVEQGGDKVITTDCWGVPFGFCVPYVGAIEDIPNGWRLLNAAGTIDSRGKVLLGYDPDGGATMNAVGATGGSATHTHAGHSNHTDHPVHNHTVPDHDHELDEATQDFFDTIANRTTADDYGSGPLKATTDGADTFDVDVGETVGTNDATADKTGLSTNNNASAQAHTAHSAHDTVSNKQEHVTAALIERYA